MSELKVYHHELRHNEYEEFYLKSEADKVIAELKDIDSKNRSAYYKDLSMMAKDVEHHKYKRCLAMAKLCKTKRDEIIDQTPTLILSHVTEYLTRWENRWLELAEKFKEAK